MERTLRDITNDLIKRRWSFISRPHIDDNSQSGNMELVLVWPGTIHVAPTMDSAARSYTLPYNSYDLESMPSDQLLKLIDSHGAPIYYNQDDADNV